MSNNEVIIVCVLNYLAAHASYPPVGRFCRMGIGFIFHNPSESEADVKAGLYGEKAKNLQ